MNDAILPPSGAATAFRDGFCRADGLPAVPIVLGVVGHRQIPAGQRDRLRKAIVTVLEEFRKEYPETPLVVLTSLAQGADQIAADATLAVKGAFLRVPLPFTRNVFQSSTSFDQNEEGERGRREVDRLLDDKSGVESFVVPLPERLAREVKAVGESRVATEQGNKAIQDLRHACYANVGGFITRRSHVLIALWDGQGADPSRPSGTGEFVALKLFGRAPANYPWTDSFPLGFLGDRGLVIHVPLSQENPEAAARLYRVLMPNDEGAKWSLSKETIPLAKYDIPALRFWRRLRRSFEFGDAVAHRGHGRGQIPAQIRSEVRQFREICSTIEDFNWDVTRPGIREEVQDRLVRSREGSRVPGFDEVHNRWLGRIGEIREAAASVANHLDRVQFGMQVLIFVLLAFCAAAFHLYSHLTEHETHEPWYLYLFAGGLIVSFVVVTVSWWKRFDQRRIDSRTLAEALRIRQVWAKAGIGRSVADSYFRQLRSELSWIRQVLLHASPPPLFWSKQFELLSDADRLSTLNAVRTSWVREQKRYFGKRWRHCHRYATIFRVSGLLLASAAWIMLIAFLVITWKPADDARRANTGTRPPASEETREETREPASPEHPSNWMLIGTSIAIISGGLLVAYSERRCYEELARQYERMEVVFEHGLAELKKHLDDTKPPDICRAQAVIEELGRESMMEHAQWLILRRSRPLELQIGG